MTMILEKTCENTSLTEETIKLGEDKVDYITPEISSWVIGGVDTHKDIHVAAIVDVHDQLIDTKMFPTTRAGYRAMMAWMNQHG